MIKLTNDEVKLITDILEDTLFKLNEEYEDAIKEWDSEIIPIVKFRLRTTIKKLKEL